MGKVSRPLPARLGEKLLQIRLGLGLSQQQLTQVLGLGDPRLFQGTISNYELGKSEPSLPSLLKYARLAGITVEILIDDDLNLPDIGKSRGSHTRR